MAANRSVTAFADRIAKYGMTPKDLNADLLHVGRKQLISLGALGRKPSFHPARFLRAAGVQDVKRWIGTPDLLFKANPKVPQRYPFAETAEGKRLLAAFDELHEVGGKDQEPRAQASHAKAVRQLINKNRNQVRAAAKAFVFGDSSLVIPWQRLLDFHFRDYLVPFWLYGTVVVESGGVLLLDEGDNILAGRTLVIEEGGAVRSTRNLHLDFMELKRTQ